MRLDVQGRGPADPAAQQGQGAPQGASQGPQGRKEGLTSGKRNVTEEKLSQVQIEEHLPAAYSHKSVLVIPHKNDVPGQISGLSIPPVFGA